MADLSDVTAYLAQAVASAVYPNGTSQPSVAGLDCLIYEGWPIPDALDLDIQGKQKAGSPPVITARSGGPRANVSIFPMQGTGRTIYQVLDDTYTIVPVNYGMTIAQAGNTLTVTGQPNAGEFITLIADDTYIYSLGGANTAAILSALATAAQVNYPSASSASTTLTVPASRSLVVRHGGVGTLGKVIHRQCHPVMITVWAPTRVARAALASAIDIAVKENLIIALPDTSQALVTYSRTNVSDEMQSAAYYRRDLIYDIDYATLQTFPGVTITSVSNTITNVGAIGVSAPVTALT